MELKLKSKTHRHVKPGLAYNLVIKRLDKQYRDLVSICLSPEAAVSFRINQCNLRGLGAAAHKLWLPVRGL